VKFLRKSKKEGNGMNLKRLLDWILHHENPRIIKEKVNRDRNGEPKQNDISVATKLISEIKKRALLIEDHLKKANKFEKDIVEYLGELKKRNIIYEEPSNDTNTNNQKK
jgi:hypothetical protein